MVEGRKLERRDSLAGDSCMTGREMSEKTNKPNYGVTDENYYAASNLINEETLKGKKVGEKKTRCLKPNEWNQL